MSISQYTLALIAMCLNHAFTAPDGWGVSVVSLVQALQGMTVIFNCSFRYPYQNIPSSDITAWWLEDPCHQSSKILYNSEEANNEGVSFIGDLNRKNCSLQLHDVKRSNKNYCFRFKIQGRDSWTGRTGVNLIVYAHPTKPVLSAPTELVEGVKTTLTCSSSEIDEHVQSKLEWSGLSDKISENTIILETRTLQSTVTVALSHRDHNKVIKCSVISSEYSFKDEVQMTLNVKYAPQNITIKVKNRSEIKEGDEVSLSCASNSNPEATYSWYKRDKGQVQDFTSEDGILLFQSISQSDSGFYNCMATNYLGNQSSEAVEISVQYAPRNVNIKMENRTEIKEGDEVSLSCASNSNPEATYSWFKRDKGQVQYYNSKVANLLFQSISQSDSGLYTCVATNYLGNQSSEAVEISVQYAPKNVTIQVEARLQLKIKEGDEVSLSCASNSNPEATFSWFKRDKGQVQDLISKDGILLFQNISLSDSGFYSCMATNYLGNRSSEAVEISVQYAPKNVTIQVEERMEITEGDTVSLSCASNSNPEATCKWYKRDKGQVQAYNSKDGILLFQNFAQSDFRFYSCMATNYLRNQSSEAIEIFVEYAPKNVNIKVENRTEIKEGDEVSLSCASNSNPEATYSWFKRDKGQVQYYNSKVANLLFQSISQSDSGLYTCTATNYLGNRSSEVVEISVQYAPKNVTIQVEARLQLKIKEGDEVSLSCASNSNPEATYSWFKRDKGQVQDLISKDGILLFQNISLSDSGFYSCMATNYLGNRSSEAVEISVQYAPKNVNIKMENRTEIKEGDEVSLSCASNSNPEATYSWFKRDKGQVQDYNFRDATLLFQSISQSDSGLYSCIATNYLGSQSSDAVEILVQFAPRNTTIYVEDRSEMDIKEGDNISLLCSSRSYPEATYTWYRKNEDNSHTINLNSPRRTLVFHSISRSNSGLYICTASNYLGKQTSEDWKISVQYKPTQVNLTQVGISFHCITEANPPAKISWNNTDTAVEVQNGTWTISILTLQTMSSGCVSCQAQNKLGFTRSEEHCFKSAVGAILPTVIAGSIIAALLLFAIWVWTQKKDLFRGRNMECDSQPVIHTEMQDLTEITQTSNSVISSVYNNLFMSKSGERKWKFSRKSSGNSLHYASLQFVYKHEGRKEARPDTEQAELDDAQVTPSSDIALYENMTMFKTNRKKPGVVGEESTVYACIKTDNLQDDQQ